MIELLLTVLVLMIGIVSVAQLVPISVGSNLKNRNDASGLIAAQTLLGQMTNSQQHLIAAYPKACPSPAPFGSNVPSGNWGFCDGYNQNGYAISLGQSSSGANTTTKNGCPLNSAGQIDWTKLANKCDNGYTQTEVNPTTGNNVELRWQVITEWDKNANPYRKVFIVAARLNQVGLTNSGTYGSSGFNNVIANVWGVVGKQ